MNSHEDKKGMGVASINRSAALQRIRTWVPLKYLSENEYAITTASSVIERCAKGRVLFRANRDTTSFYYILSGTLAVVDADGDHFVVEGGSVESTYPITPDQRWRAAASALTDVEYIQFPVSLMQLGSGNRAESIVVEELTGDSVSSLENKVIFDVYHSLMIGELVLPSLPDIAIRIRRAASSDKRSVEEIARIIQADASTTAYCINVANTVAYRGQTRIDNILDAVVRMGIETTRDIVVSYTLRSLFSGKSVIAKRLMREAWKHSCRIAALSFILAREVGRLNPERALLAGLLHDIGVTVMVKETQTHKELLNPRLFVHLCHELCGQIGAMILRSWKFPDVFVDAALEAEHFTKPVVDRLQLADMVVLAHLHDSVPAPWSIRTNLSLSDLAFHDLLRAYDVDEDDRLTVVEQADQEMAELTRLLSS